MILFACAPDYHPDIQGHRGCRGLMPENTLPAFLRAVDIGVTTLEMDVVISRDNQVVVSHEPFMSHEICQDMEGREITAINEEKYNLYQMTFEEIEAFDCGSKVHPRFPDQEKIPAFKPLLRAVIDSVEVYLQENKLPLVRYNIETKSSLSGDGIFHPEPEVFVDLLVAVLREKKILDRCTIQSFDVRTLQVANKKYPDIPLVLLVENQEGLEANLQRLGFTPEAYSPHFQLVDQPLIDACHAQGMKVIPWTVNERKDINRMIELRVDGIISDYPDRVVDQVH
jgi:glycerophosphoryl diester phosphodiesterase